MCSVLHVKVVKINGQFRTLITSGSEEARLLIPLLVSSLFLLSL